METGKIGLGILLTSAAVVLGVEWIAAEVMKSTGYNRLVMVGLTRCLQVGLIFILVMRIKKDLDPIGLTRAGVGNGIVKGVYWSIAFGVLVLTVGTVMALSGINPLAYLGSPYPGDFKKVVPLLLVGGVIGPVAEEVFFRGLCYGYFRRWGVVFALLLTTTVFVAAHTVTSGIPVPQIVGGIVFALAYEIEKNLMVPIVFHISGNLALYVISWIV
jgi:uncharacterized protein